jgi:hypothetical protein
MEKGLPARLLSVLFFGFLGWFGYFVWFVG